MTDNRTTELPMEHFRAALEKRGIEYETNDDECAYGEPRCTVFKAHIGGDRETDIVIVGVKDWYFDGKLTPWLDVEFHNVLTPEQAIAVTLGRPKVKKVRGLTYDEHGGEVYYLACSGCGDWVDGDLDCIGEHDGPNFCHNCGGEFDGPLLCRVCGELADMEFGDMCAECYWHEGEGNDER